jgi:hypothetical protein
MEGMPWKKLPMSWIKRGQMVEFFTNLPTCLTKPSEQGIRPPGAAPHRRTRTIRVPSPYTCLPLDPG